MVVGKHGIQHLEFYQVVNKILKLLAQYHPLHRLLDYVEFCGPLE